MNQIAMQFTKPVPRVMAMTGLVVAFAFSGLAVAAVDNLVSPTASKVETLTQLADATPARSPTGTKKPVVKAAADSDSDEDRIESRIKHLHDKLAITTAQEDAWNKVAVVMQANAEKMTTLVKDRAENAKTMTAVDNLQSYAEIAGAHEDGTRKLIPVFKSLYDGMSEDQKKMADTEFRQPGRHAHHHNQVP